MASVDGPGLPRGSQRRLSRRHVEQDAGPRSLRQGSMGRLDTCLDRLPGGQKLGTGDEPVGVVIPGELGQGLLVGPELICEGGEILVAAGGRPPGLGEPRTGKRRDHHLGHERLKVVALREDAPASVVRCFRAATIRGRLVHAGDKRLAAYVLNVTDPRLARRPTASHAASEEERSPTSEPAPTRAVREDLPDRLPGTAIKDRRPGGGADDLALVDPKAGDPWADEHVPKRRGQPQVALRRADAPPLPISQDAVDALAVRQTPGRLPDQLGFGFLQAASEPIDGPP